MLPDCGPPRTRHPAPHSCKASSRPRSLSAPPHLRVVQMHQTQRTLGELGPDPRGQTDRQNLARLGSRTALTTVFPGTRPRALHECGHAHTVVPGPRHRLQETWSQTHRHPPAHASQNETQRAKRESETMERSHVKCRSQGESRCTHARRHTRAHTRAHTLTHTYAAISAAATWRLSGSVMVTLSTLVCLKCFITKREGPTPLSCSG